MTGQSPSQQPSSGREPGLGPGERPGISGFEPLLGGSRRAKADPERMKALLNSDPGPRQTAILEAIEEFGQSDIYAAELSALIPASARRQMGTGRGGFTPSQRERAVTILARIGLYESLAALVHVLDDGDHKIRSAAEASLKAVVDRLPLDDPRTKVAYRALVGTLRALPRRPRQVIAAIISDAPSDLVLGSLLRKGLDAPEWYARRDAAWILGRLGDRRATMRLIDTLSDENPAVRATAAWALGQLDAPIAVNHLIELASDQDEVVRAAVAESLGLHISRLYRDDRDIDEALAALLGLLKDPFSAVRHAALDTLLDLDVPRARLALKDQGKV
ncbi:MAG: HEAT repeat domain-containing protein [Chloroflexi bacterium]|nr:HEAT repeat domain-containing protein [Chloroflexota bacterium]